MKRSNEHETTGGQAGDWGVSHRLILLMAVCAGAAAANNYYNQPLLPEMAQSFHVSAGAAGLIPAATQVGYAVGLFFVAPLGDRHNRKHLIAGLATVLCCSLLAAAAAPSLLVLIAASLMVGVGATLVQQLIPLSAQLAAPKARARVVGTVMTGLTIGILLARTASGALGDALGWRSVFLVAAGLAVLIGAVLMWRLPATQPSTNLSYPKLLSSMWRLIRTESVLQRAAVVGGLWFACFGAFWSTLALHVEGPPFHFTTAQAGLFGLVGVAGAFASRASGQIADRLGSWPVIAGAISLIFLGFIALTLAGQQLWGLLAGVILLDFGVFAAQVANQARIFALAPEARSRINAIYMVCYYGAGALGSALGAWAWQHFGWSGVCTLGLLLSGAALLIHCVKHRSLKIDPSSLLRPAE